MITDEQLEKLGNALQFGFTHETSVIMELAYEELRVRRQLQKHVKYEHGSYCENWNNPNRCSCGLSDLLFKLKELEGA